MTPTLYSLIAQAMTLPREQRILLAERLWSSVHGPLEDEELFAEIERREAEIESGVAQAIPFDQAMSEIRDALR